MTEPVKLDLTGIPILVVEDDPVSLKFISKLLTMNGAEADTAVNGIEALELLSRKYFPVVVTDIRMPEMDGITLSEKIRQIHKNVRIIATSANRDTKYLLKAIELGFSDYIIKPIDKESLLWSISKALELWRSQTELEMERKRYKTTVDSLGEALSIKDKNYTIIYQNRAMTELFGNVIGRKCYELFCNREPCGECPTVRAIESGVSASDIREVTINGRKISIESTASLLTDINGNFQGSVEIIRDITERVKYHKMLEDMVKTLSHTTGVDFFEQLTNKLTECFNLEYAVVGELSKDNSRINTRAFSHKGIPCKNFSYEIYGTPCQDAIENRKTVVITDNASVEYPENNGFITLGIKSYIGLPLLDSKDEPIGMLCCFSSWMLEDEFNNTQALAIFASRGAAELERFIQERIIKELAFQDPLTKLANRRLFDDRLTIALARTKREATLTTLFYIDLDHFKDINDSYGHETGDTLLVQCSQRLQSVFKREVDTISRIGGDEFCIITTSCDSKNEIQKLAESALKALTEPYIINGERLTVTASIGIAIAPDNAIDAKLLKNLADRAMYEAKVSGRNAWRFC